MDYPSRDFNDVPADRRVAQQFTERPVFADAEVVRWLEERKAQDKARARERSADRLYLKLLGIAPL